MEGGEGGGGGAAKCLLLVSAAPHGSAVLLPLVSSVAQATTRRQTASMSACRSTWSTSSNSSSGASTSRANVCATRRSEKRQRRCIVATAFWMVCICVCVCVLASLGCGCKCGVCDVRACPAHRSHAPATALPLQVSPPPSSSGVMRGSGGSGGSGGSSRRQWSYQIWRWQQEPKATTSNVVNTHEYTPIPHVGKSRRISDMDGVCGVCTWVCAVVAQVVGWCGRS